MMKHLLIRLAVASAMFTLGVLSAAVPSVVNRWDAPAAPGASAEAEEELIVAAVFRFQMENHSGLERPRYYLSCHNYADPPRRVLNELRGRGFRAETLSQFYTYDKALHFADGRWYDAQVFLRAGRPKWAGDGEAIVGGSVRGRWEDVDAYVYRVVREGGVWKVVAVETVS